jgi:hypothetical protein
MQKKRYATSISAPREKVWKVLWDDATYRAWTSAFTEGSYAVSDWKEGSSIQFLAPDGNGMYSTIARSIPNEFMSFRHIGMMKEGKELPLDEETKKWSGAHENYTLKEANGKTELLVEIDMADEHANMFDDVFPRALAKVKELSEK